MPGRGATANRCEALRGVLASGPCRATGDTELTAFVLTVHALGGLKGGLTRLSDGTRISRLVATEAAAVRLGQCGQRRHAPGDIRYGANARRDRQWDVEWPVSVGLVTRVHDRDAGDRDAIDRLALGKGATAGGTPRCGGRQWGRAPWTRALSPVPVHVGHWWLPSGCCEPTVAAGSSRTAESVMGKGRLAAYLLERTGPERGCGASIRPNSTLAGTRPWRHVQLIQTSRDGLAGLPVAHQAIPMARIAATSTGSEKPNTGRKNGLPAST